MKDKPSYNSYLEIYTSNRYRNLKHVSENIPFNPTFLQESCIVRSAMACVGGGVIGFAMGFFFHTLRPLDFNPDDSFIKQVQHTYKGIGEACKGYSKGFAKFGAIYTLVECFIERERAVHDVNNAVYAGCATGAALAYGAGPLGMAGGCLATGAFCGIAEVFLMSHSY
eukprot:GHVL01036955.1.p1 GENE.GHVL01036955.1~~GHVL01036955.1.p1  ORF type:complete len:197 (+),score=35.05 GHVL01036955.1:88-591(+)